MSLKVERNLAGTGQALYRRAKQIIPGAAQLFGKRAELYAPDQWPAYYSKAQGCEIWDMDGNRYIDCTMVGIGTSVLGYADPDVEAAVYGALRSAPMTTLNPPEDVYLAELLLELHPWADMVSYARTGGEVMSKAVRIARAATGRDKVAFCGYHGWHDWYLAVNLGGTTKLEGHLLPGLEPLGVPKGLAGTMFPFAYNSREQFDAIIAEHGSELAAIVMEPVRGEGPAPGFLEHVRATATKIGAVLFFDEITCGWRMNTGGAHQVYGITPDLVTYAKTMSNGVPMAAIVGNRAVMEAAQATFISSAYWTERLGPTAALTTIKKHRALDAGPKLGEIGARVQKGWAEAGAAAGLKIKVSGIPQLASFSLDLPTPAPYMTFFIQEMLDRGFLASDRFYPVLKHEPHHIDRYLAAVREVFGLIAEAHAKGDITERLKGPVKATGFARLA
jgi:glutamate-1-semialdehyde 2,1-aminomutase